MNCTNQLVTTMIDSNATSDAAIAVVETLVNTTVEVATNTTTAAVAVATALLPLTQLAMAFEPLIGNGYIQNSLNFLFFGTVLETGRRLWNWIMDQFTGGFVLTAIFDSCDPAYEWFFAFLNDEKIWATTREFHVSAKTNSRTWGVNSAGDSHSAEGGDQRCAEYLPTYDRPQVFRFKGTFCQVTRQKSASTHNYEHEDGGALVLTLYTRKRAVLDDLIQTARERFLKKAKKARLTVHGSCSCGSFCQSTTKARRALDSLILPTGVKETLVNDARDFLRSEAWYAEAGIQHKRGYLLYGPPGTGKSSTVHALAGELDLEIYSLSLATNGLDDAGLSRLVSSTPAHSIILIEDIDCAFPSREELQKKKDAAEKGIIIADTKSTITLSGLLNVIDGCSSEEGRLLFATTNYVNRLDPALLRAGRMDVKIHYKMSTRDQIVNLFKRFYPCAQPQPVTASVAPSATITEVDVDEKDVKKARRISDLALTPPPTPDLPSSDDAIPSPETTSVTTSAVPAPTDEKFTMDTTPIYPPRLPASEVDALATRFADAIPVNVFSVAELQNYLLTLKTRPYEAVEGVGKWIKEMEEERERLKLREEEEREREEKERKARKEKKEEKEEKKEGGDASTTATTTAPSASASEVPLPAPAPTTAIVTKEEKAVGTD